MMINDDKLKLHSNFVFSAKTNTEKLYFIYLQNFIKALLESDSFIIYFIYWIYLKTYYIYWLCYEFLFLLSSIFLEMFLSFFFLGPSYLANLSTFCSTREVSSLGCGTAVAPWLRRCVTNRKVAGSIPAGVSGFFIDVKSFRSHYGPGVDSASNRNEYQEYFLCKADNLPPSCTVVTKSGSLNFLRTLWACPGQ